MQKEFSCFYLNGNVKERMIEVGEYEIFPEFSCFMEKIGNTYSLFRLSNTYAVFEDIKFVVAESGINIELSPKTNILSLMISINITEIANATPDCIKIKDAILEMYGTDVFENVFNEPEYLDICGIYELIKPYFENKFNLSKKLKPYFKGDVAVIKKVMKPLRPVEELFDDKKLEEIRESYENNKKSKAYIERIDDDSSVVRIFIFHDGKLCEHSRIFTEKEKTIYLANTIYGWLDVTENIKFSSLAFDIEGKDEIDNMHIGRCLKHAEGDTTKMCFALINNAFENLVEMKMDNIIHYLTYKDTLKNIHIFFIEEEMLNDKNKCSFASFIGYPNYVVPMLNKYHNVFDILTGRNRIKYIFQEYLKIHNKNDAEELIKNLSILAVDVFSLTEIKECVETISIIEADLNKAIKHIVLIRKQSENFHDDISLYRDYLLMLTHYNLFRYEEFDFKWNVPPERIWMEHYRVTQEINKIEREGNKVLNELFEKTAKKNNKYAYSSDELSVIVPNTINDLNNEGRMLHHCVSSYAKKVAHGETIVLFIRENNNLDKPFFTLEIRDNMVRQCHGKCNCDMTDEVKEFLCKYCKEKGIEMLDKNNVLAV